MEEIKKLLALFAKKSISINELEELIFPFIHTYEEFACIVLSLEKAEILTMVKSKGRTSRSPSIAYQYKINKQALVVGHQKELQQFRLKLHPEIIIDAYFRKDPSEWKKDLPYIEKIDHYLNQFSFPTMAVPAPERSFELVNDEKWIVESGGKELLERLQLWEKLKIIPVGDPLMFAINPKKIKEKDQLHLIVENKTTYQALSFVLTKTQFATLIYGCGKKIIKSIEQFSDQYPVTAKHHFFYFGDIDKEGMTIYYLLKQQQEMQLALPFYEACLKKIAVSGKAYQRDNQVAIECYLTSFPSEQQLLIRKALENGMYYPQEILKTSELQQIWRDTDWIRMILKN